MGDRLKSLGNTGHHAVGRARPMPFLGFHSQLTSYPPIETPFKRKTILERHFFMPNNHEKIRDLTLF